MNSSLQTTIELAWEARASLDPANAPEIRTAVEEVIAQLDAGKIRVAEKRGVGEWSVNQWSRRRCCSAFA
jgi:2,3,4,5-tetrahydropyridine-2-carboxylate N-succinyltransferase